MFNEVPELYDRVRPRYPDGLFADFVAIPRLFVATDATRTVQNLAANHGLFVAAIFAFLINFIGDVVFQDTRTGIPPDLFNAPSNGWKVLSGPMVYIGPTFGVQFGH